MIVHDTPRSTTFRFFTRTSHCSSTLPGDEGTAELLAFGRRIGLREAWLQNRGTETEHFDLFDGAIDRAVRAGSREITGRELIRLVVWPKRAARRG